MSCVAVTQGGWGKFYLFADKKSAEDHPLVQYGDSVLCGPDCVVEQYNVLEIGRLLAMLGDEKLRLSVLRSIHPELGLKNSERVKRISERAPDIWDRIKLAASQPPADPSEIIKLVAIDRKQQSKESTMEDVKNQEAATAAQTTKAEKPVKAPKPPKYANDDIVRMLSDKDGKQYGADNNPKRSGSATAIRFANYRDGVTVGELLSNGDTQSKIFADLDYDQAKGFIEIEKAI